MIDISNRKECFFDDFLIDREKTSAPSVINNPRPEQIVMEFNMDWETNTSFIHFFYDEGIYRMYYIAWNIDKYIEAHEKKIESDYKKIRCCYMESRDGISWERPNLGLYEWMGDKNNNIIFMADWLDNFYVFKDENPNCPKDKKYKATARTDDGLIYYYSKDGIHFEFGGNITNKGAFDTMNVIFWDKQINKYRGYIRSFHNIPIEGGGDYLDYVEATKKDNLRVIPGFDTDDEHAQGAGVLNLGTRDIRYIESEDFVNWSEPMHLDFASSPDIPLYTNCVSPYPGAEHIYVGFPTRYTERNSWSKSFDVLCGREQRLYKMEHHAKRMGLAITDCLFMASRDGINFKRYDKAYFRNGPETGSNWVYGDCYPAKGFVITKSGFEGADDELCMFCPEFNGKCDVLRRYAQRMDGFVSLHADEEEKVVVTKPFVFEGNSLYANMATTGAGYMYFELKTADGTTLKSCEMFGDSTGKKIGFDDDLSKLSGKEVVLTVTICDGDLYSVKFDK